uniref:Uncharacterized protein n=1 Tax=viral metagenome TaxID=1070528 RepID=A0A6C0L0Z2_9ZZZZ|tara:strand:- start:8039 stop:8269 length:231 start_codon:yes stop_codon:yes gene_type:complete
MIVIDEPHGGQLYKVEWFIQEGNIEGYGIGTYSLYEDSEGHLYFDFKIDGERTIYRFEMEYIVSVQEYNFDKRGKL